EQSAGSIVCEDAVTTLEKRLSAAWPYESVDERQPSVRVAHEAESRAALAHLVGRALGLDALLGELGERGVEVLDPDSDVTIGRAQLVREAVVVERQLEHVLGVAQREEVVRRLQLPVADDVHVA